MNIILTGMRGTGKSSIGRLLAELLTFTFIDTDASIEAVAGCSIAAIVARYGWAHFRMLERQAVARIAAADKQVIATGGGTLIDDDNARRLKARGVVILLVGDIAILQRRIASGTQRPSLTGQTSAVAELEQVWEARRQRYYAVADLTYDVSPESADFTQDIRHKAAAISTLLQHTVDFQADTGH